MSQEEHFMSTFFDTFSALCKEHGETPNSIGKTLNIPSGSITAWKNGTIPRAQTLGKIADHFSVTTDYLLTGKQAQKAPAQEGGRKRKLRSVARLESADITPELDKNIADYIDYLLTKRDREE